MIGNENNFIGKKCGSLHSYEINACIQKEVPMGYACPKTAKGNFFLKTESKFPFGKGRQEQGKKREEAKGQEEGKKNWRICDTKQKTSLHPLTYKLKITLKDEQVAPDK